MEKCPNCPHPLRGLHKKSDGKCKYPGCGCQGPTAGVKGKYVSTGEKFDVHRALAVKSGKPKVHVTQKLDGAPLDVNKLITAEAKRLMRRK